MSKQEKFYCKIGQAVVNGIIALGFCTTWIAIIVYALVK